MDYFPSAAALIFEEKKVSEGAFEGIKCCYGKYLVLLGTLLQNRR